MRNMVSGRVRFGDFELDLTTGELRSTETPGSDNKVLLREQVFQVMRMLIARERKIVSREEIKGRLWPNDTVVDFDHSINATIKTLRRALGDSADSPRYVETLARRGYRLLVAPANDADWLVVRAPLEDAEVGKNVEARRDASRIDQSKLSNDNKL